MKNIIIVSLFLIAPILFAQVEQQAIELPDFVITGKQSVVIPTAKKAKPDLISVVSKDFYMPQYASEALPLLISSTPVQIIPSIKTDKQILLNNISISVGKYTMPNGEFNLHKSYENYLFSGKLWGKNITEYIPYAGYNNSGFAMSHDLYVSTKSSILPGSKFSLDASYWRDSYNFYGSNEPWLKRETNNVLGKINFENNYYRWMNFGLNIDAQLFAMNSNSYKEFNLTAGGNFDFKWNKIMFGTAAAIQKQYFYNAIDADGSNSLINAKGFIEYSPASSYLLKAGVNYYSWSGSNKISPFGIFEMKIDEGLSASIEYNPIVKLSSVKNFISKNLYYSLNTQECVISEFNNRIVGNLRYEFEKTFLVNIYTGYSKNDNYYYFDDTVAKGKYQVLTANGITEFFVKLDGTLYPGLFGYLEGQLAISSIKDMNDRTIPYEPALFLSFAYGNYFSSGFNFKLVLDSKFGAYSDAANSKKLDDYVNLSAKVGYNLFGGINLFVEAQNLLNKQNFIWANYQEKQFDYLIGINYSW